MSERTGNTANIKQGRGKALIIGISHYKDLRPLELCKNDAEEISAVLINQKYEILDSYKLIGEITYDTLRSAIFEFFGNDRIRSKDTLLFYFSGHGIPDGFGKHYLATSDIDKDRPALRGISFEELDYCIETSKARRILAILDCCFSGAAGLDGLKGDDDNSAANKAREAMDRRLNASEGRCILASSLSDQQSVIKKDLGHSLFTYHLLEALKGKEGYVNANGYLTVDLLSNYVFEKIVDEPRRPQMPIKKSKVSGELIVAYYPQLAKSEQQPIRASSSAPGVDISSIIDEGLQYYDNNENDKARIRFDKALEINPTNAKLYNYKGDTFFNEKNYPEAIKWYDEALKLNPTYRDVLKDKGLSLIKLGRYPEAISCFDAILERNTDDVQFWEHKGFALLNLGEYDEAMKCYQKIVEIEPDNVDAWIQKAGIFEALKRDEDSLECYKKVLSLDPHNKISQRKIETLQSKAQDHYRGPTPLSADKIDKFNALMREGSALSYKNEYEQALKKFDDAMNINPNSSNPFSKKSSVLIQMSEYKRALEEAHKALKIDPNNVEALFNKGYILASAGRYDQAIEWYDKMTDLDFTNANAWLQKGMCYERIGNKVEAKECFKIAKDLKIK